jgi:hypothetical protein
LRAKKKRNETKKNQREKKKNGKSITKTQALSNCSFGWLSSFRNWTRGGMRPAWMTTSMGGRGSLNSFRILVTAFKTSSGFGENMSRRAELICNLFVSWSISRKKKK